MTYNLQNKDYIFIPTGENQDAVSNLMINLRDNKIKLENNYIDKIKNIQNNIYTHQTDDNKLQVIFNQQKDLENQENLKFYQDYQKKQNDKINNLLAKSNELQNNIYNPDFFTKQTYGIIQSSLGQHLSLTPININDSYMINVNQSCIFNDKDNNFSLKTCDNNSLGQRFKLTYIYDEDSYYKEFNQLPTQEIIKQFPFNIVKSNVSNGCLTDNNNTGISINECKSLEGQKWFGLKNTPQKCFSN